MVEGDMIVVECLKCEISIGRFVVGVVVEKLYGLVVEDFV